MALLLAAVGVYGVVSFSVTRRTREIAVRSALGARSSRLLGLLLRQGMAPVLAGAVVGVVCASALTRFTAVFLYRISPTDVLTFGASGLLLILVAAAAAYMPARRAARIDPTEALRHE
jgi:putative ABC transport system permease protein